MEKLENRADLFVFLHEAGHVKMGHLRKSNEVNPVLWRDEYEADQYAIAAMRACGVPIPRERLATHKGILRELIEASHEHPDEEEILKYAYGKQWRKHR